MMQQITMDSLNTRILTGLLLGPTILVGIYFLPVLTFAILLGILIVLAATEWPRLIGKPSAFNATLYATLTIIFMLSSFLAIHADDKIGPIPTVLYAITLFFWLLALIWVLQYNITKETLSKNHLFYGFWGLWVLVPCWFSLVIIHGLEEGRLLVIYLLLLVWLGDTAAYFSGKLFGVTPMVKNVSPKKTWEGFYGQCIICFIFSILCAFEFSFTLRQRVGFIFLSMLTVLISIVGDLFISVLKRQHQLKDTGKLLPGHGGILDRIDSLTAAAPTFAVGLLLLGLR